MATFGAALKRAREQRGVSLDEIGAETRLSKRYILALEDEAISKFAWRHVQPRLSANLRQLPRPRRRVSPARLHAGGGAADAACRSRSTGRHDARDRAAHRRRWYHPRSRGAGNAGWHYRGRRRGVRDGGRGRLVRPVGLSTCLERSGSGVRRCQRRAASFSDRDGVATRSGCRVTVVNAARVTIGSDAHCVGQRLGAPKDQGNPGNPGNPGNNDRACERARRYGGRCGAAGAASAQPGASTRSAEARGDTRAPQRRTGTAAVVGWWPGDRTAGQVPTVPHG